MNTEISQLIASGTAAIKATADMLHELLIAAIEQVEEEFPLINFAGSEMTHTTSDTLPSYRSTTVEGRGLIIGQEYGRRDRGWWLIILHPDGVLRRHWMVLTRRAGGNSIDRYPDVEGETGNVLTVQYTHPALDLFRTRPVTLRWNRQSAAEALPWQEFCRRCGHVALANEFYLRNICPNPECGETEWYPSRG